MHQYLHLHSGAWSEIPRWFDEGYAVLFEDVQIRRGHMHIEPSAYRRKLLVDESGGREHLIQYWQELCRHPGQAAIEDNFATPRLSGNRTQALATWERDLKDYIMSKRLDEHLDIDLD